MDEFLVEELSDNQRQHHQGDDNHRNAKTFGQHPFQRSIDLSPFQFWQPNFLTSFVVTCPDARDGQQAEPDVLLQEPAFGVDVNGRFQPEQRVNDGQQDQAPLDDVAARLQFVQVDKSGEQGKDEHRQPEHWGGQCVVQFSS